MSELRSSDGRDRAIVQGRVRPLAPIAGDGPHAADLSAAVRFDIGQPGDTFVIATTGKVHVLAGDATVDADGNSPVLGAGSVLTLPDDCTHVSLLAADAGAQGCAYRAGA